MARTLLLIDANSLIHRAFHALPHLSTSDGTPTNAVFGLAQMLLALLGERNPDDVAMVFDAPGPTFRHRQWEQYKANRPPMDEALRAQYPLIDRLIEQMGLVSLQREGFEADDIIGTLAERARAQGYETTIVTGDRDLLQLLAETVTVLLNSRGTSQMKEYTPERFREEYGLEPARLVDLKALAGDSSDNIPGIPGIGEKTATRLLTEYGTLETALEHAEEVRGAVGGKLAANAENAMLFKHLARIERDVPLGPEADDLHWRGMKSSELRKLLAELEFTTLLERLPADAEAGSELEAGIACADEKSLEEVCSQAARGGSIYVAAVRDGEHWALSVAADTGRAVSYLVPGPASAGAQGGLFDAEASEEFAAPLARVLADPDVAVCGCRLKELAHLLAEGGHELANVVFDAEIASYLISPHRSDHSIGVSAAQYLGWAMPAAGGAEVSGMAGWRAAGCTEALATAELQGRLRRELRNQGMEELFDRVEMPLSMLLFRMERAGIGVDLRRLGDVGDELDRMTGELATEIWRMAGGEFNIDSPKQVGEVLFGRLGLPKGRKTSTGWSTAASILEELAAEHQIAALILEYREYAKLRGTYVDGLARETDATTGLVHTTFEQTVASTGRLASRNPNLQNVPIRTEWGRAVRGCFNSGREGYDLVCADYSQIELRILAHLSRDETLVAAFAAGEDVHARTAALIFDCGLDEVGYDRRSVAKMVNYAVLYGMGARALAQSLGIDAAQAKEFIEQYHARFPAVEGFMEQTVETARKKGYVSTVLGRRRPIPDLDAGNPGVRAYAERAAGNAPLQGSAADIVKLAMLAVDRMLQDERLPAEMLLQVHDDIILRAPTARAREVALRVKGVMEGVYDLSVPLIVDAAVGHNWRDVEPVNA